MNSFLATGLLLISIITHAANGLDTCRVANPLTTNENHPENKCSLGEALCICDFIAKDISSKGCALNYWIKCVQAVRLPSKPISNVNEEQRRLRRVLAKSSKRCPNQRRVQDIPQSRPDCKWYPQYDAWKCVTGFYCRRDKKKQRSQKQGRPQAVNSPRKSSPSPRALLGRRKSSTVGRGTAAKLHQPVRKITLSQVKQLARQQLQLPKEIEPPKELRLTDPIPDQGNVALKSSKQGKQRQAGRKQAMKTSKKRQRTPREREEDSFEKFWSEEGVDPRTIWTEDSAPARQLAQPVITNGRQQSTFSKNVIFKKGINPEPAEKNWKEPNGITIGPALPPKQTDRSPEVPAVTEKSVPDTKSETNGDERPKQKQNKQDFPMATVLEKELNTRKNSGKLLLEDDWWLSGGNNDAITPPWSPPVHFPTSTQNYHPSSNNRRPQSSFLPPQQQRNPPQQVLLNVQQQRGRVTNPGGRALGGRIRSQSSVGVLQQRSQQAVQSAGRSATSFTGERIAQNLLHQQRQLQLQLQLQQRQRVARPPVLPLIDTASSSIQSKNNQRRFPTTRTERVL